MEGWRCTKLVGNASLLPTLRTCREPLDQRSGIFAVAIHNRVGAHERDGLDRQRGIEAAHRRVGRAAEDEEVGDVPTLAVAIHYRRFRITAHARAALMVGAG